MATGAYAAAARVFGEVADDEAAGRLRAPAAYDVVLSLEAALKNEATAPLRRSLVAACDRLAEIAPEHEARLAVMLKAAAETEALGDRAEAARRYRAVATAADTRLTRRAARAWVALLSEAEDYRALESATGALMKSIRHRPTAKFLARVHEGAAYKRIGAAEKRAADLTGKSRELARLEVAEAYRAFVDRFERSEFADEALLSAALVFADLGRVDRAIEASSLMAEAFGDSPHAAKNLLLYADLHARTARLGHAARIYHQFAVEHPNHDEAPRALRDAARLYGASGQKRAERRALTQLIDRHPRIANEEGAPLTVCETWTSSTKSKRCFGKLARSHPNRKTRLMARYRAANLTSGAKAAGEYRRIIEAYARIERPDPELTRAAAHAAFALVEPRFQRFSKLEVGLDAGRVKQKTRALEQLVCADCKRKGDYVQVMEYGDAKYGVAALVRIGGAYRNMADALEAAPMPTGLTEEQLEHYRALLAERVLDLRDRAVQALELAVHRAQALGVYDEYVLAAHDALGVLAPHLVFEIEVPPFLAVDALLIAPIRTVMTSSEP